MAKFIEFKEKIIGRSTQKAQKVEADLDKDIEIDRNLTISIDKSKPKKNAPKGISHILKQALV